MKSTIESSNVSFYHAKGHLGYTLCRRDEEKERRQGRWSLYAGNEHGRTHINCEPCLRVLARRDGGER